MRHCFSRYASLPCALPCSRSVPSPMPVMPKCRNVSGYEPKKVCEARNQRAQWQAEYTAKVTAQLMAKVIADQATANAANETGIMDTVNGIVDGFVSTVRGFF